MKRKKKPTKITVKWIMETYNLNKPEATRVRALYEQELIKMKADPIEADEGEDIFSDLDEQEKIFCLEYLQSYNMRNAAVKAGYSPRKGSHLMEKDYIIRAIKQYQERRTKELFIDVVDITRMYMGIAFCDITDYVDFGTEDVPILDSYGKTIYDEDSGEVKTYKRSYVRLKDSTKIDGRFIQEVKSGKDGVSIKLFDKMPALDKLGKIFDIEGDKATKELKHELEKTKLEIEKAKAKLLSGDDDSDFEIVIKRASERSDS